MGKGSLCRVYSLHEVPFNERITETSYLSTRTFPGTAEVTSNTRGNRSVNYGVPRIHVVTEVLTTVCLEKINFVYRVQYNSCFTRRILCRNFKNLLDVTYKYSIRDINTDHIKNCNFHKTT
jgi:hypothetical protein